MLSLPDKVTVAEVGPRDGLQSLGKPIDTATKVRMIDRLSETGLPVIEVTGFAHPRVIPNLADAEEVCARITRRPGTVYRGLVPNARGAERAAKAKVDEMLGLITVSETYLKKNQNMTRAEAVAENIKAFRIAEGAGIGFVMALGMSMWCSYEGTIPEEKVVSLVAELRNAGIRRYYLAGSTGMEDPRQVNGLFRRVGERFGDCEFGYHVHNMSGFGTANILAGRATGAGVNRVFELAGSDIRVPVPADRVVPDGARLVFRPQAARLLEAGEAAPAGRVLLPGTVAHREFLGAVVRYGVRLGGADGRGDTVLVDAAFEPGQPLIEPGAAASLALAPASVMWLAG